MMSSNVVIFFKQNFLYFLFFFALQNLQRRWKQSNGGHIQTASLHFNQPNRSLHISRFHCQLWRTSWFIHGHFIAQRYRANLLFHAETLLQIETTTADEGFHLQQTQRFGRNEKTT